MAEAQQQQQEQQEERFRSVVIDCHSVGYAASELKPGCGGNVEFRVRNIVLCILSLMKIYLLVVFDPEVFLRYEKKMQSNLLKKFASILTSVSNDGKQALENLAENTKSCSSSTDSKVVSGICKEIQSALLRQDVHFRQSSIRDCIKFWKYAGLPSIVLCCDFETPQVKKQIEAMKENFHKWSTMKCIADFVAFLPIRRSETKEDVLLDYSESKQALIISNNKCQYNIGPSKPSRIPFVVTDNSTYFYLPKDPHGRNEDTLMQDLILPDVKLSRGYDKA